MNLRNFNPRKIKILVGFWYETIFPQWLSVTSQYTSDVEIQGESFGGYHVIVRDCPKKRWTKNLEKRGKIHENSGKFEKIHDFFAHFYVFFHNNKSKK